jgi:hypothetical protein
VANKDAFRAKMSVNQTGIANAVDVRCAFNVEVFDVNNKYDSTNYRWTPSAGVVQVGAGVLFSAGIRNNTTPSVKLFKNGACIVQNGAQTPTDASNAQVMVIDQCNGTDYYECFVNAQSAGTSTIAASNFITQFFGAQLW